MKVIRQHRARMAAWREVKALMAETRHQPNAERQHEIAARLLAIRDGVDITDEQRDLISLFVGIMDGGKLR